MHEEEFKISSAFLERVNTKDGSKISDTLHAVVVVKDETDSPPLYICEEKNHFQILRRSDCRLGLQL